MLFNLYKLIGQAPMNQSRKLTRLKDTIDYIFPELSAPVRADMLYALASLREDSQLAAAKSQPFSYMGQEIVSIKGEISVEQFNIACLATLRELYHQTKMDPNERHFPVSHETFLDAKARKLASIITATNPGLALTQPGRMRMHLDIGCGDCQMTRRVSQQLGTIATGVELATASDHTLWTGSAGKAANIDNDIVYYDGVHLSDALKERTRGYHDLFDVITFNHVLHHYPDRDAQIQGLQKAMSLLKEGGVILFSEHATIMDDEIIELQHVLFDLKNCSNNATKSNGKSDWQLAQDSLVSYVQEKHAAHYFSQALLIKLAKSVGLSPIYSESRLPSEETDASKTVITGFVKTSPTLTPEQIAAFTPQTLAELQEHKKLTAFDAEDKDKLSPKQGTRALDDSSLATSTRLLTRQGGIVRTLFQAPPPSLEQGGKARKRPKVEESLKSPAPSPPPGKSK
jgi:2-polyprenyl-3-methyl-5-hydroxy-6-metoxy-1,4-benzoquinol methylase